ncbi:MAG: hypothetical protein I8H66_11700 [Sphingobacteriia bacterium]|nr:hypothetical protein [Sphingobacteriia bacterium]
MMKEVEEIVNTYGWKYSVYHNFEKHGYGINNKITGIRFSPPACETVSLCFFKDCTLCDPHYLQYGSSLQPGEIYTHSVKTQFTGLANHIIVVSLLKYLARKYFESFVLEDDSKYFETENPAIAQQKFETYDEFLRTTSTAIQILAMRADEGIGDYAKRLAKYLEQNSKKK